MIEIRKFDMLGHANHGGVDTRHHFSFADYRDPDRMRWGALCAWNDNRIAAHAGSPSHLYRDMEVITYVRTGAITHRSLGRSSLITAGGFEVLSAGSGISRSEINLEQEDTTLFQIWIQPDQCTLTGHSPCWGTRQFSADDQSGTFVVLASGMDGDDALPLRAKARVAATALKAGQRVAYELGADRRAYIVATDGRIRVNGQAADPRDGVAIRDVRSIEVEAIDDTELFLVDNA